MRIVGIVFALICFMLLVLGHEFGHFSVGKLLGFKINEFSVGMGPKLWGTTKGETDYSFRAIPLGGYCAFEGEEEPEDEEDEDGNKIPAGPPDPRSFNLQPAWKKLLVLVAGSFNNFVIGIIVLALVFTFMGVLSTKLSGVVEGAPAAQAGILEGDTITAVNGTSYSEWSDIVQAISKAEGDSLVITVERGSGSSKQTLDFTVNTYTNEEGRKVVGILAGTEHSLGRSVKMAFGECGTMINALRDFFGRLFKGQARSEDVGSIVQIVAISGEYAELYGLRTVIYLIGLISINLGFMNMLPIPGLDGGRALFVIIRWITRGKLSAKVENTINSVFMALLIALMVFLMFKDIIWLVK